MSHEVVRIPEPYFYPLPYDFWSPLSLWCADSPLSLVFNAATSLGKLGLVLVQFLFFWWEPFSLSLDAFFLFFRAYWTNFRDEVVVFNFVIVDIFLLLAGSFSHVVYFLWNSKKTCHSTSFFQHGFFYLLCEELLLQLSSHLSCLALALRKWALAYQMNCHHLACTPFSVSFEFL